MKEYRIEHDGKATFAIVQAEDELAAIGMVIGHGWAGARSMTATAGPGNFADVGVFRTGLLRGSAGSDLGHSARWTSTGLPTRTSQGDILSTAFLSHGDTKNIMLIPCSVAECFSMASDAFNLAEQFQTLVFVMSDLDLGMNNWMSDPFEYPTTPIKRGKVLNKEELTKLGGFARYKDLDGDGVGYRTLPGTEKPAAAYFTRGSGHNDTSGYSERPDDYAGVFGAAMVGGLFSADAWATVTFTASEVKNPRRDLPLALAFGTGLVILLYILTNVAYLCELPAAGVAGAPDVFARGIAHATSDRVAAAAMEMVWGGPARRSPRSW